MKKSILMALVLVAILAAPVFAGEFGHQIVLDAGFGVDFDVDRASYKALTDGATRFGVFGTLDDNNSIGIVIDLGGKDLAATWGNDMFGGIDEFTATTNIFGALGVESPVTLSLTYGYGRVNLHNRFNQWTGWEWTGRKGNGDLLGWGRQMKLILSSNIMGYVNVNFGMHPNFDMNKDSDGNNQQNIMLDIWGTIPAGPVSIDLSGYLINRADNATLSIGGEAQANMAFGPVSVMVAVNELMQKTLGNADIKNTMMFAVKPVITAGPATIGLGFWMDVMTQGTADAQLSMAMDAYFSIAMITIFGGVRVMDLDASAPGAEVADSIIFDFGIKAGFGATSIALGINGGKGAHGGDTGDMNAVDGTTGVADVAEGAASLYVKISTQMW